MQSGDLATHPQAGETSRRACSKDDIEAGRLYTVRWQDMATTATVLPELETDGRNLIERRLGYLPHECHYLTYEPYIRGLIHRFRQGQMNEDDFLHEVDEQVKFIRNSDMQHNTCLTYDEAIYRTYDNYVNVYGHAARDRLTEFLGYIPQLEHSLIAELWLQEILARDDCRLPLAATEVDARAITLIKFREMLLQNGLNAAKNSPLFFG